MKLQKTPKERIKVCALDAEQMPINSWVMDFTDPQWIKMCKRKGFIYSLNEFEGEYNESDATQLLIRFIDSQLYPQLNK